ncbi:PREDICTED: lysine-rich nucleolar protein 1 isoform X2 [Chinchilla lanigera]|nr:PREDICTED: lysine-rich nucleolar protein 1 isoform X2 [Chinchilla lanigera]XP_005391177.1 PREDICTED: lysine-rich nucleolar protein 1 isoform X2 [Chinchilla lanigera]
MITKTQKVDVGLGLPEKKKKRKVVKEPETQYSIINDGSYFAGTSPVRAKSLSRTVSQEQAPHIPLVKKKKKTTGHRTFCSELPESEPTSRAGKTEKSPSPRKQALDHSESFSGEKKKKKKSLPLVTSQGSELTTSLNPRQGEEATRVGKKLKKHKKKKKAQDTTACSIQNPWLSEAGDGMYGCMVGNGEEQAALGQKRKQGKSREHSRKVKKKKVHREEDTLLGCSELSRSMETSPRKGKKKKPVRIEVLEYIPIGEHRKAPVKKKTKAKKKEEKPVVEPAQKRKKKKKKESTVAVDPCKEEPDTDLEVVMEKKGNMDEAHIDQVRRKALQEEIDRESGKIEAPEPGKWTGTQFGQWDTAGFENKEQKLKFLKLMGGFKNLSPSVSRSPGTTARPNMALSKAAADTLQQKLQQDYERAMSWKYSRGAGLGFSAAPNKVFYIDKNASRSVKLED